MSELELKNKPVCCEKEMHKETGVQQIQLEGETDQYVCLECGGFINVTSSQLDEEELINYKETYGLTGDSE